MLKDCSIKILCRQMFYSEWICFLNKGQKCSGILKFLSSHILICQVCNNQNDTQTMGSLQKVILFSLVWMVLANPFCFKKSMKNQGPNLDKRQTRKSALAHLHCIALKIQLPAK